MNVQHDTVERMSIERLVFIVRCDSDEKVSLMVIELGTQCPPAGFAKIIGIDRSSAILHVAVWSLIRVQVVRLFETRNTDENSVVLVIAYLALIAL